MKEKYDDHLGFPVYYLEDEIIHPHQHKLICCYTNQVTHFTNISTSRAEGQYAKLKANLVFYLGINVFNF